MNKHKTSRRSFLSVAPLVALAPVVPDHAGASSIIRSSDVLNDEQMSRAIKDPCRVATTNDTVLEGLQVIDGVRLAINDRVVVRAQTDARDNGIYLADIGPWRRSADFASASDAIKGTRVWVVDGDSGPAELEISIENPSGPGWVPVAFELSAGSANSVALSSAAASAVAARDIAAGYASDAVSQGNVPIYGTFLGMPKLAIPAGINGLRVNGYARAGDGGMAFYRKVTSEPMHAGKFRSEDGSWWEISEPITRLKQFGAKGDGIADDTAAVIAAFSFANGFLRDGLVPTVKHPGAALILDGGRYNLATLSTAIVVRCNLVNDGAEFIVPAAYAGEVIRVGMDEATYGLASADIHLPDVTKPVSDSDLVSGSTGVRIVNLNASKVWVGRTNYFETGVWLGGVGEGTVYCDIFLGQHSYCRRNIVVLPGDGGWCNANRFYGGNLSQSPGFNGGGIRRPGWRHLLVDGRSPGTAVIGNIFFGISMEGNASEYVIEAHNAYDNVIYMYFESAAPYKEVRVLDDVIWQPSHGRVVGDMVSFSALRLPSGMTGGVSYYVVSVPNDDTYKVALSRDGVAASFSPGGFFVKVILQNRCLFSQVGAEVCVNNKLIVSSPFSALLDIVELGNAFNNCQSRGMEDIKVRVGIEDFPIWRGFNDGGRNGSRAVFAAYANRSDAYANPRNWNMALSDRGLLFGSLGEELGRLFNSEGILSYQAAVDKIIFEIPRTKQNQVPIMLKGLVCVAGVTTYFTFEIVDVVVGDCLAINPLDDLPAGLILAWCRVVDKNTARIAIYNATVDDVELTTTINAISFQHRSPI